MGLFGWGDKEKNQSKTPAQKINPRPDGHLELGKGYYVTAGKESGRYVVTLFHDRADGEEKSVGKAWAVKIYATYGSGKSSQERISLRLNKEESGVVIVDTPHTTPKPIEGIIMALNVKLTAVGIPEIDTKKLLESLSAQSGKGGRGR